ncbi:hypothetical protein PBI_VC3_51 [Mycobacterium phage VC3]|nr:hypothetical protein PBI_VC3_51 [Mycobacterium phage VC3]QJD52514.1 hypothetical protein PBI_ANI8_51 [Mycobacterium phage ANI8]BBC43607.1 hypothetical protein [Mycobacterium phage C3]
MAQRATVVNLANGRYQVLAGEPIVDTQEGVLIIAFEDGTSHTFNWRYVIDFYYMTAEETERLRREGGR